MLPDIQVELVKPVLVTKLLSCLFDQVASHRGSGHRRPAPTTPSKASWSRQKRRLSRRREVGAACGSLLCPMVAAPKGVPVAGCSVSVGPIPKMGFFGYVSPIDIH